jgi:hypothetical protein
MKLTHLQRNILLHAYRNEYTYTSKSPIEMVRLCVEQLACLGLIEEDEPYLTYHTWKITEKGRLYCKMESL